jgi:hypothetical protein
MEPSVTTGEDVEYRVVFVDSDSDALLAVAHADGYRLPCVRIPRWTRPAKELRRAIHATFGINALILDVFPAHIGSMPCAVAEVLSLSASSGLTRISLANIPASQLSEAEYYRLIRILQDEVESPFSRIGWINAAIAWLESSTGHRLSSRLDFEQYNAGAGFTLVRFRMDDGLAYWLKATSEPNTHELSVTSVLSKLCGEYLPAFVASKASWNAWIAVEEATRLDELPKSPRELVPFLENAAGSMAAVQLRTAGHADSLLQAGAFDQRLATLSSHSEEFFSYIEEAMAQQTSTKVPCVGKPRLKELRHIFDQGCERLDEVGLPEMVVHGDMNVGNILIGRTCCQFIDWAEAYVGNPLITLQHLLLLNQIEGHAIQMSIDGVLKDRYQGALSQICDVDRIDEGYVYMPLLAAFSALYARGDWLATELRNDSRRQAYARTLARYMDRAAREPQLCSALRG